MTHRYRQWRLWREQLFRFAGQTVTLSCVVLVCVFLWRLGSDGLAWFREMPRIVAERNDELRQELKQLDHAREDELAALSAEMDLELSIAATDDERQNQPAVRGYQQPDQGLRPRRPALRLDPVRPEAGPADLAGAGLR